MESAAEKDEWDSREWVERNKRPRRPNGIMPRIYRKCCAYLDALDVEYETWEDHLKREGEELKDQEFTSFNGVMFIQHLVALVEENNGIIDGKEDDIDQFFKEKFGHTGQFSSKFDSMSIKAVTGERAGQADFLKTYEWRVLRYKVLKANDGKCELCGRGKHDGAVLNVDHIKPRAKYPELALSLENLQVLCGACNHGKGNHDETDWRG